MAANEKRPVHLNLLQIRFPVPAVMSIGHRISGVLWILLLPAMIFLVDLSLSGPQGFARAGELLGSVMGRLAAFLLLWALMHHLLAGIRYLALDLDLGIEKQAALATAWWVMLAAPLLAAGLTAGLLP